MGNDLFAYLDLLELMAFFSGYPLIYTIIHFAAGKPSSRPAFKKQLIALLPFSYAVLATLYMGLQLRNMWPDYSWSSFSMLLKYSLLKVWGLLGLLFWIPFLNKKPILSLLHSLVFFFFLLKDILDHNSRNGSSNIKNDMKIYTDSLLLNTIVFVAIAILYSLWSKHFKNKASTH